MTLFLKSLVSGAVVNLVITFPFFLLRGFALVDAAGIVGIMIAISALGRPILVPKGHEEEWAIVFPTLFPVVGLVIHAIGWSVIHYEEARSLMPSSLGHWIAILAAVAAFALLIWFSAIMRRRSNSPNKRATAQRASRVADR